MDDPDGLGVNRSMQDKAEVEVDRHGKPLSLSRQIALEQRRQRRLAIESIPIEERRFLPGHSANTDVHRPHLERPINRRATDNIRQVQFGNGGPIRQRLEMNGMTPMADLHNHRFQPPRQFAAQSGSQTRQSSQLLPVRVVRTTPYVVRRAPHQQGRRGLPPQTQLSIEDESVMELLEASRRAQGLMGPESAPQPNSAGQGSLFHQMKRAVGQVSQLSTNRGPSQTVGTSRVQQRYQLASSVANLQQAQQEDECAHELQLSSSEVLRHAPAGPSSTSESSRTVTETFQSRHAQASQYTPQAYQRANGNMVPSHRARVTTQPRASQHAQQPLVLSGTVQHAQIAAERPRTQTVRLVYVKKIKTVSSEGTHQAQAVSAQPQAPQNSKQAPVAAEPPQTDAPLSEEEERIQKLHKHLLAVQAAVMRGEKIVPPDEDDQMAPSASSQQNQAVPERVRSPQATQLAHRLPVQHQETPRARQQLLPQEDRHQTSATVQDVQANSTSVGPSQNVRTVPESVHVENSVQLLPGPSIVRRLQPSPRHVQHPKKLRRDWEHSRNPPSHTMQLDQSEGQQRVTSLPKQPEAPKVRAPKRPSAAVEHAQLVSEQPQPKYRAVQATHHRVPAVPPRAVEPPPQASGAIASVFKSTGDHQSSQADQSTPSLPQNGSLGMTSPLPQEELQQDLPHAEPPPQASGDIASFFKSAGVHQGRQEEKGAPWFSQNNSLQISPSLPPEELQQDLPKTHILPLLPAIPPPARNHEISQGVSAVPERSLLPQQAVRRNSRHQRFPPQPQDQSTSGSPAQLQAEPNEQRLINQLPAAQDVPVPPQLLQVPEEGLLFVHDVFGSLRIPPQPRQDTAVQHLLSQGFKQVASQHQPRNPVAQQAVAQVQDHPRAALPASHPGHSGPSQPTPRHQQLPRTAFPVQHPRRPGQLQPAAPFQKRPGQPPRQLPGRTGHPQLMLPYPGRSGVQFNRRRELEDFRDVATNVMQQIAPEKRNQFVEVLGKIVSLYANSPPSPTPDPHS